MEPFACFDKLGLIRNGLVVFTSPQGALHIFPKEGWVFVQIPWLLRRTSRRERKEGLLRDWGIQGPTEQNAAFNSMHRKFERHGLG